MLSRPCRPLTLGPRLRRAAKACHPPEHATHARFAYNVAAHTCRPFEGTTMKLTRIFLAVVALMLVTGVAYVAQQIDVHPPAPDMVTAAQKLVVSLTADQKSRAIISFDSKERTNWNFVPLQDKEKRATRKGLPLEDMTPDQKKAAL